MTGPSLEEEAVVVVEGGFKSMDGSVTGALTSFASSFCKELLKHAHKDLKAAKVKVTQWKYTYTYK